MRDADLSPRSTVLEVHANPRRERWALFLALEDEPDHGKQCRESLRPSRRGNRFGRVAEVRPGSQAGTGIRRSTSLHVDHVDCQIRAAV